MRRYRVRAWDGARPPRSLRLTARNAAHAWTLAERLLTGDGYDPDRAEVREEVAA